MPSEPSQGRLREGLQRAADAPVDVEHALRVVLSRRRQRVRARRTGSVLLAAAAVVVAAVVLPAVVGGLLRDPESLPPAAAPSLRGTYVVDVDPTAAVDAYGLSGRWIVELAEGGSLRLTPPATFSGPASGSSYGVDGDLVRVDAFVADRLCQQVQQDQPVGTYRWARTAAALVLEPVSEACPARELLFAGQPWTAVP